MKDNRKKVTGGVIGTISSITGVADENQRNSPLLGSSFLRLQNVLNTTLTHKQRNIFVNLIDENSKGRHFSDRKKDEE